MIPLLLEAIKEQQKQIESLQEISTQLKSLSLNDEEELKENKAQLFQNKPNPYSDITKIEYYIPDGVQKAIIMRINRQLLEYLLHLQKIFQQT